MPRQETITRILFQIHLVVYLLKDSFGSDYVRYGLLLISVSQKAGPNSLIVETTLNYVTVYTGLRSELPNSGFVALDPYSFHLVWGFLGVFFSFLFSYLITAYLIWPSPIGSQMFDS